MSEQTGPAAQANEGAPDLVLELFVSGPCARSALAIANLRRICEQRAAGTYQLEIVDVLQDPARAAKDQVVATPTLLRRRPAPERRLAGDLSAAAQLLAGPEGG